MHMQYMLHCGVITNDNIEINIREKAHEKGGRKNSKNIEGQVRTLKISCFLLPLASKLRSKLFEDALLSAATIGTT